MLHCFAKYFIRQITYILLATSTKTCSSESSSKITFTQGFGHKFTFHQSFHKTTYKFEIYCKHEHINPQEQTTTSAVSRSTFHKNIVLCIATINILFRPKVVCHSADVQRWYLEMCGSESLKLHALFTLYTVV
jgi:hypothetical protein